MTNAPWVLGISASHNGAACLLRGDQVVVAIQEERLTRRKRDKVRGGEPSLAIQYCLDAAGIAPEDLSMVAVSAPADLTRLRQDVRFNPQLHRALLKVPSMHVGHHRAHAISAWVTSGLSECAVLVIDGVGSPLSDIPEEAHGVLVQERGDEIISMYAAGPDGLRATEKHLYPFEGRNLYLRSEMPQGGGQRGMRPFQSLGRMFGSVAGLIFGSSTEAGKVMGLAPYGEPTIPVEEFLRFEGDQVIFSEAVTARFQGYEPWPAHQEEYQNLAASTQRALEVALLKLVPRCLEKAGTKNLCYAGGVALNSVANELLVRELDLDGFYVVAAAEDSGPALGSAYEGLRALTGSYASQPLVHDSMGRAYTREEIDAAIDASPSVERVEAADPAAKTAELLADGKIVAWFQGGSELGPRALGHRSILCDPRREDGKETLNRRVKHREAFRPFAPAILEEKVTEWFETDRPASPFMLRVMHFKPEVQEKVPAVVHVDGTGRVQTVTAEANEPYYRMIQAFEERTGVPIVVNTSFNVMGEPIVETPGDALWALLYTDIDYLVLHDQVVKKRDGYHLLDLYPYVTLQRWRLERPITDGSFRVSVDGRTSLEVDVETPWGDLTLQLSPHLISVLQRVDGRRTGREILEALPNTGERELIEDLGRLRRLRALSFRDEPRPDGE
jgi:carbamoyltransferase